MKKSLSLLVVIVLVGFAVVACQPNPTLPADAQATQMQGTEQVEARMTQDMQVYQTAEAFAQATVTAQAAASATPSPSPSPSPSPMALATLPVNGTATQTASGQSAGWTLEVFSGATPQMLAWNWQNLNPSLWPTFPNVDNPSAGFLAANGLEYAEDETGYCEQDLECDIVVPAMHYRIVTGDYSVPNVDSCTAANGIGCGIMLINVGSVSSNFENGSVNFGFTVYGRYFNGDALPEAIWAALSHVGSNMLDLQSELNPNQLPNAGANCSVPTGCTSARLTFVIVSGNQVLIKGTETIFR